MIILFDDLGIEELNSADLGGFVNFHGLTFMPWSDLLPNDISYPTLKDQFQLGLHLFHTLVVLSF